MENQKEFYYNDISNINTAINKDINDFLEDINYSNFNIDIYDILSIHENYHNIIINNEEDD